MATSFQQVVLIGTIVEEPKLTSEGRMKGARFRLQTTRGHSPGAATDWHRCVAHNRPGEAFGIADVVARYGKKGSTAFVHGRLEYREFTDREGRTRPVTDIVMQEFVVLGPT